jgi:hypothetical protein
MSETPQQSAPKPAESSAPTQSQLDALLAKYRWDPTDK